MKLTQLINSLGLKNNLILLRDFEVKGVAANSKEVGGDFIFVAVKGSGQDGRDFIQEAISRGARAIVAQAPLEGNSASLEKIPLIEVEDARLALAKLACAYYGEPSSSLKVIGITGTNGKTTIGYLLEAIFQQAQKKVGVIGTVNYRFGGRVTPAPNTTPGAVELQGMLKAMREAGTEYVAMEVSSHALDQERARGTQFTYAIFTNLTQDHLDYHHSLEDYFFAKAKLFQMLGRKSAAIINIDDPYGRRLKGISPARIVTYAIDASADLRATDITYDTAGTKFIILGLGKEIPVKTPLIGKHNVYNILAASAVVMMEGFSEKIIQEALEEFSLVPGRLQRIPSPKDFGVFVDYAHTEDALRNVISSLRQVCRGRIIVVFGCGGDRDQAKRPKMGEAVTKLADYGIITSDNPRSEDPAKIAKEIEAGIAKDNYCVILDREQAIQKALSLARPRDVVLIAGKGHENYQIFKERKIHFDDCEVAAACLKSMS